MPRRMPSSPLLAALVATTLAGGCADPGGNLVGRRDTGYSWDAASDARQRDATPWDPGAPPQDPGNVPTDPGHEDTPTPQDPGTATDPGIQDPGHDPGTTAPTASLVTNAQYEPRLLSMLAGAKTSIRVAHLSFGAGLTPDGILSALAAARNRGVDVRVVLEEDVDSNGPRLDELSAAGVPARLDHSNRTMHAKLVVVDERTVLVGSTNWTFSSMARNNEANWAFDDGRLGTRFAAWVDAVWSDADTLQGLDAGPFEGIVPLGAGQYLDRVGPFIDAAQERVWVTMYQVGWDDNPVSDVQRLVAKLADAANRGADVRVVLEDSDWNDDLDAANQAAAAAMRARGITVRFDTEETTTHAKTVIADDAVALYSGNWLYSGLRANQEAGAVVTDPALATQAAAFFQGIWDVSW